ncbi:MAG: CidA/LrgA family protein [Rhodospirillales bacterium]|nr:CidA/LrgA family protein [Rhodospirillales bacterium]MCW8861598.1 CidA/LrgA family protein [Rhodospirillales bacterium]MCW8951257.1 CidA/LrgA family protein [Rhodospirillales bacterium]MCW8971630.1 CidA/LrgA family protein [Rhodospirillales bacterium]MCW9002509.1 CidA/LrgA family protein [Rhodospirillales bacterium]
MVLRYLTLLLVCQLAGEAIRIGTGLPIPGPVIGMVLLFVGLLVRRGVPEGLQTTSGGILQHLSLLFVPAGVGVMVHLPLLADEWAPIVASLILSTVLTIAVTALVMKGMGRLTQRGEDRP